MGRLKVVLLLPLTLFLSGCNFVVLNPSGDVAAQQGDLVVFSTVLMLLIIVPVMALTVLFAWRYRHTNTQARYDPEWDHSTQLELVIWGAPLLIIICLGALTWMGTHLLDPYRGLDRVSSERAASKDKPLVIEAIALDWKWLFIYPDYGIATVNDVAAPVDRPISFHITSATVMNSFYIPALAGQIYAMAGMETKLHAVINERGSFKGFSANYSGAGFSGMHFKFHGVDDKGFDAWIAQAKAAGGDLTRERYMQLEKPSENVPVQRYAKTDPELYRLILNMCVQPGKMCTSEMMAIDAKGGLGLAGARNTLPLAYDKYARPGAVFGPKPTFVAGICDIDELGGEAPRDLAYVPRSGPLRGVGLPRPDLSKLDRATFLFGRRAPTNS